MLCIGRLTDGPEIKYELVGPLFPRVPWVGISVCSTLSPKVGRKRHPEFQTQATYSHVQNTTEQASARRVSTAIRWRFAPCFLGRCAATRGDAPFPGGQDTLYFTRFLPLVADAKTLRTELF